MSVERLIANLSTLLIGTAGLLLMCMLVHMCADVAMKYVFNSPIPGTAEVVAYYYMVAAVFLPLPFVEVKNGGVSVDLFYNMMGKVSRRVLLSLAYLVQIVFFGLLAWQSSIDAFEALAKRELVEGQINVYIWPARFFLPIGFGLASIVSLLRLYQVLTQKNWETVTGYGGGVGRAEARGEG